MNGWLLVRIAGIVVGIATLLRLATNEKLVTYDPLFLAWMDWLSDIVELGFLTKLIGPFLHWGIDYVRSLGIEVPDLQSVWNPIFVISMLLFGGIARHANNTLLVMLAPVIALIGAVFSGLTGLLFGGFLAAVAVITFSIAPAAGARIVWISCFLIAFLFAAFTIAYLSAALVSGRFVWQGHIFLEFVILVGVTFVIVRTCAPAGTTIASLVSMTLACITITFVISLLSELLLLPALGVQQSQVASLLTTAVSIGITSIFVGAISSARQGPIAALANPAVLIGFDILSVLSGALIIASIFANPPIW